MGVACIAIKARYMVYVSGEILGTVCIMRNDVHCDKFGLSGIYVQETCIRRCGVVVEGSKQYILLCTLLPSGFWRGCSRG